MIIDADSIQYEQAWVMTATVVLNGESCNTASIKKIDTDLGVVTTIQVVDRELVTKRYRITRCVVDKGANRIEVDTGDEVS